MDNLNVSMCTMLNNVLQKIDHNIPLRTMDHDHLLEYIRNKMWSPQHA